MGWVLFSGLLRLPRRCVRVDGVLSFWSVGVERMFEPLGVVFVLIFCFVSKLFVAIDVVALSLLRKGVVQ